MLITCVPVSTRCCPAWRGTCGSPASTGAAIVVRAAPATIAAPILRDVLLMARLPSRFQGLGTGMPWSLPLQLARFQPLDLGGVVEEGVAVADDRLREQLLGLRPDARMLADRGADGHDLDQAAAQLVDEDLDPDDAVGAKRLGLGVDVRQAVLAGVVDQPRDLVDLAARERLEEGGEAAHEPE